MRFFQRLLQNFHDLFDRVQVELGEVVMVNFVERQSGFFDRAFDERRPAVRIEGGGEALDKLHARDTAVLVGGRHRAGDAAGVNAQRVVKVAARQPLARQKAGLVAHTHQHRPRAVGKEGAGFVVGVIDKAAHTVSANHQDVVGVFVGGDEANGRFQSRHPACTGAVHIKRARVHSAEFGLQHRGRGRAEIVGRIRGHNDEIDLLRREMGPFQRFPAGVQAQIAGGFIFGHDVPGFDAHVFYQPGIYIPLRKQRIKVGVGQHFFRHVAAGG